MMQAVILAAGEGKRLRPLTKNRPKALIPVANRPIIDYSIQALVANGIRDIIVVVGYRKEHVIRHLNRCGVPLQVVEQKNQLGTGDALKCAEPLVKGDFLVLPGDNYIDAASLAKIMNEQNAVLVQDHPYPSNFGVVLMKEGEVTGIIEKPEHAPSFTVSTGIFSLSRDFFSAIKGTDLTDAVNEIIARGGHLKAVSTGEWQDAVYPWDLLALNRKTVGGIDPVKSGIIDKTAVIRGPVRIGKGTNIGPFTVINGPAVIGEDAIIGPHCLIGPSVSIGNRVTVESFTLIEDSLLMDDSSIGSHSRVVEAVIGEGSGLSDHTTVAPGIPLMEIEGILIRGRFGCIIGDQVRSEPLCIYHGAIVGNDARIRGGKMITGLDAAQDGVMVV
jgi:glucose-1-phosphate thymidylyltransferase